MLSDSFLCAKILVRTKESCRSSREGKFPLADSEVYRDRDQDDLSGLPSHSMLELSNCRVEAEINRTGAKQALNQEDHRGV